MQKTNVDLDMNKTKHATPRARGTPESSSKDAAGPNLQRTLLQSVRNTSAGSHTLLFGGKPLAVDNLCLLCPSFSNCTVHLLQSVRSYASPSIHHKCLTLVLQRKLMPSIVSSSQLHGSTLDVRRLLSLL